MTSYRQLIQVLHSAGVEFIIVGGAAATAHGAARLTLDLDIVYRRTRSNMEQLVESLSPFSPYPRGAPPGLPFVFDRRTLENGQNFTLVTAIGDLDLLGEITAGGVYEDLLPYVTTLNLFGTECQCLGLHRLIEVKRAVGRPKDFEAIAELEAILDERLDQEE